MDTRKAECTNLTDAEACLKEVYYSPALNELSFTYKPGENVCIGETDGTLQDFLMFMREDFKKRGVDLSELPKISEDA